MKRYQSAIIIMVVLCLLLIAFVANKQEPQPAAEEAGDLTDQDEFSYEKALAARNQSFDSANAVLNKTDSAYKPEKKEYTLMVYMVGSNLESNMGNATKDMREMEASGLDYDNCNLIVYTGGSRRWTGGTPAEHNCVLDFSRPEDKREVASTQKNSDMGAAETLSAFLTYVKDNYPSDHYALICWDHGGGPLWGFGNDELFNNDSLLLPEMRNAMEKSPFKGNDKLDWIGFDACLMASYESMHVWSKYAGYYAASEEVEPGDGWDYSFLKILNDTKDPKEITIFAAKSYQKYYEENKSNTSNPDLTFSVTDLSRIPDMDRVMDRLFRSMDKDKNENMIHFTRLLNEVKSFGLVEDSKGGEPFHYDLIDLAGLNDTMAKDYPKECENLKKELGRFVISHETNVEGTSGVTLYYPARNKIQYKSMEKIYQEDYSPFDSYFWFLSGMNHGWTQTRQKTWTLSDLERSGEEYLLKLTKDQAESVTNAYYTVLRHYTDSNLYLPLIRHCKAEIDPDGTIHVPADPSLLIFDTGRKDKADEGHSGYTWAVTQIESSADRNIYRSDWCHADTGTGYHSGLPYKMQEVKILLKEDRATGKIMIQNIDEDGDDLAFSGKNQINTSHFLTLYQPRHLYYPIWDKDKNLLPSEQWKDHAVVNQDGFFLHDDISFRMTSLSSLKPEDGACVIQVTVEDEDGYVYASQLEDLSFENKTETCDIETELGHMFFSLKDGEAVLSEYSGEDEEVEIPETVKGCVVKSIGEHAFSGTSPKKVKMPDTVESIENYAFFSNYQLKTLILSKGLKRIGSRAIYDSSVEKLVLPEGLKELDDYAIAGCHELRALSLPASLSKVGDANFVECSKLKKIEGKCKVLYIKDGVAFTKDKKTLLAYPAGKTDKEYTIPDGTEKIAFAAFARNRSLKKVNIPEGVRMIGNDAFAGCLSITEISLPESLESIGAYAFDTLEWMYDVSADQDYGEKEEVRESPIPVNIFIGPKLSYIGEGAFSIFADRSFTVNPSNLNYKERDGALMNKAGDAVIQWNVEENTLRVPEGTLEISDWNTVEMYLKRFREELDDHSAADGFTCLDLVIPSSVKKITNLSDIISRDTQLTEQIRIHCEKGSVAEQFAMDNHLDYDHNMNPHHKYVTEETDQGKFSYILYQDHVLLYRIESKEAKLELPEKVQGIPLTVIGDGKNSLDISYNESYHYNHTLKELVLPDSIQEISNRALSSYDSLEKLNLPQGLIRIGSQALSAHYAIKELPGSIEELGESFGLVEADDGVVVLPDKLRIIEKEAFSQTKDFESFRISEENESFSCIDGVLFTKDHKTLVAYPQRHAESHLAYTIPDGTKEIGERAFEGSSIRDVTIPDSVKEIRDYAFYKCKELKSITLGKGLRKIGSDSFAYCDVLSQVNFPDQLQVIDSYAFHECRALAEVSLPEGLEYLGRGAFSDDEDYSQSGESVPPALRGEKTMTCHIGKTLSTFESNALSCINITKFTVDPENETYSEHKGFLYDKAGNILLMIPPGIKGEVHIPEGTLGINIDYGMSRFVTDIYIPSSVQYVESLWSASLMGEDNYTIHCSKDSPAYYYAVDNGTKCVTDGQ